MFNSFKNRTLLSLLLLSTLILVSCGGEEGGYVFDNPYDPSYNGQPDTFFSNISSATKKTGVEINPVTISWAGSDPDGTITGYYYRLSGDACSFAAGDCPWTTDSFVVYTSLPTGYYTLQVASKDSKGAVDLNSPALSPLFYLDNTPPAVSFTTPRRGAADVPLNQDLTATFNEPVDSATVSIVLSDGTGTVSCDMTYAFSTVSCNPFANLAVDTVYTTTVLGIVTDEAGNSMGLDYSWSFRTSASGATDTTAPVVSFTTPARNAGQVPVESYVSLTFSEAIAPATLHGSSFTLDNGVTGDVFLSGLTAIFKPYTLLDFNTTYTSEVTIAVTDLAGNALASPYAWSFKTLSAISSIPADPGNSGPDNSPPTVTFTTPASGATNVPSNLALSATFSEPVDISTVTIDTFTFAETGGASVGGALYVSGSTAQFIPYTTLSYATDYTATIKTGVADLTGNFLLSDYSWTFTTGSAPDLTPPSVSQITPASGAKGVSVSSSLSVLFDEALDPQTVSPVTFSIKETGTGTPLAGTVTYYGSTATFTPELSLSFGTDYTVTLMQGITDLAGNSLATDYSWHFITGLEPDLTPPAVMWTSPDDGAVDIGIGTVITATFSEPVDVQTVSTSTFTLRDGNGSAVAGSVSSNGTTATFVPSNPLVEGTTYDATLSTAISDAAGNHFTLAYSWAFTTGYLPDTTGPEVVWHFPAIDDTVSYDSSIIVEFSEPVDVSTLNSQTFTLLESGATPVPGSIYYDGDVTAIFQPLTTLTPSTPHSVKLFGGPSGVKDLAGNPMEFEKGWYFWTSALPDTFSPSILFTNPTTGETGVSVRDPRIFITFDEPLDASTVTTSTILLEDILYGPVSGNVYYDGVLTVLFKPLTDLAYNVQYSATVKAGASGVKDLAGNEMSSDYGWSFSTGDIPISLAQSIAGGRYHSLAIRNDLTAWAWGYNSEGQLGDGTTVTSPEPVAVTGLSEVVALSASEYHNLAVTIGGDTWSWGANGKGQLGNGTYVESITPLQISGFTDVRAVETGYYFSMALKNDGTVWTWGYNGDGQLGDGNSGDGVMSPTPTQVNGLLSGKQVIAIAAGDSHALALTSAGEVYAWGANGVGQLGDGSETPASLPVKIPSLSGIVAIGAGEYHSMALTSDGRVYTWGSNWYGQLGLGTDDTDPHSTPAQVSGLTGITQIDGGYWHTIALKNNGDVFTWGLNDDGQLGDGNYNVDPINTDLISPTPVQVLDINGIDFLKSIDAVAAGAYHSVALRNSGIIVTWGYNAVGTLGNCTYALSPTPVTVEWTGCTP